METPAFLLKEKKAVNHGGKTWKEQCVSNTRQWFVHVVNIQCSFSVVHLETVIIEQGDVKLVSAWGSFTDQPGKTLQNAAANVGSRRQISPPAPEVYVNMPPFSFIPIHTANRLLRCRPMRMSRRATG